MPRDVCTSSQNLAALRFANSSIATDLSAYLISLQQGSVCGMAHETIPSSMLGKGRNQRLFEMDDADAQTLINPLAAMTGEQVVKGG